MDLGLSDATLYLIIGFQALFNGLVVIGWVVSQYLAVAASKRVDALIAQMNIHQQLTLQSQDQIKAQAEQIAQFMGLFLKPREEFKQMVKEDETTIPH